MVRIQTRTGVFIGCVTIACLAAVSGSKGGSAPAAQERVTPIPAQSEQDRVVRQPVGPLMLAKLSHTQRIIEGLVTQDFEKIATAAKAMKLMSLDLPQGWQKQDSDGEVYEHFRLEFMRQTARLEKMADEKNAAGAAYFQQNLTATCIACHDYIRDFETTRPTSQK